MIMETTYYQDANLSRGSIFNELLKQSIDSSYRPKLLRTVPCNSKDQDFLDLVKEPAQKNLSALSKSPDSKKEMPFNTSSSISSMIFIIFICIKFKEFKN